MTTRQRGGLRAVGCLVCLAMALAPVAAAHAASSVAAAPMPVACDGPRDLIVERGPVFLRGTRSFDRVCVRDGGTLVVEGSLTLRAGILDVAPRGVIDADGEDGYESDNHDCIGSVVQPNGARGYRLTIIARHAIVRGRISSDGGHGLSYGPYCDDYVPGTGGPGGSVTIIALDLALDGHVTARGGAGSNATASKRGFPPTTGRSGDGGPGGRVTIAFAQGASGPLGPHVDVGGGRRACRVAGPLAGPAWRAAP